MIPKLCDSCGHSIGLHSHLDQHPCKVDRCGCWSYDGPRSGR